MELLRTHQTIRHQAIRNIIFAGSLLAFFSNLGFAMAPAKPSLPPVDLSLLSTNDLHSHFRGEKNALGLGGVARLKTVISKFKKELKHTLVVDAGDWSEGQI